jgi:hypothetical protein
MTLEMNAAIESVCLSPHAERDNGAGATLATLPHMRVTQALTLDHAHYGARLE